MTDNCRVKNQWSTRILVAGANGNLGKSLVSVLCASGREVTALVRPGRQKAMNDLDEFSFDTVAAEVTRAELPKYLFEGVHTVVSCIGITRQRDGLTYEQVDYQANLNLLRAAEGCGVKRFIYVSVVGAETNDAVPVMKAKRRFEKILAGSSLEWLIVRPSGFFTDMTDVLKMALKGGVHLFGDGKSRISPIHTMDLAEYITGLIDTESGRIFSVGGPVDYCWNEVAEMSCSIAGKGFKIYHWPVWMLILTLVFLRIFSRPAYGTLSFLGYVMTNDTTSANHGIRRLEDFFHGQLDNIGDHSELNLEYQAQE